LYVISVFLASAWPPMLIATTRFVTSEWRASCQTMDPLTALNDGFVRTDPILLFGVEATF
jgi:hypothetical protein